jgi:ectoine hydroxylase-related dioxygenase (phytanoyl-CoA dioxygenase family)
MQAGWSACNDRRLRPPDATCKFLRVTTARETPMNETTKNDLAAIERDGYLILERLLSPADVPAIRKGLAPHLGKHRGRNDFEGHATERIYSLVAIDKVFEDLAEHPRIVSICDEYLEPNYLLTASQAIHIHPGETPQQFHTDDSFYRIPRPRKAISMSTIWAIDDFTAENGATQVIPGSHLWGDDKIGRILYGIDFATKPDGSAPTESTNPRDVEFGKLARDVVMPAGSVIVFLGTLVHRGGRSRTTTSRLALSNQYCAPWARPQENFFLSIPRERAARMSERLQSMLGYSIHFPFMGHVLGEHPKKLLR